MYHNGRSCCIRVEPYLSFGAPLGTGGAGQVNKGKDGQILIARGGGQDPEWVNAPPNHDFPQRLVPCDLDAWTLAPVYPHIQKLGLLTVTTTDDGAVSMDVDNSPFLPDGVTPRRYVLGQTLTMIVNTAIDARLNELKAKVEAMWDAPGMPGWMEVKDDVEKIAPDE